MRIPNIKFFALALLLLLLLSAYTARFGFGAEMGVNKENSSNPFDQLNFSFSKSFQKEDFLNWCYDKIILRTGGQKIRFSLDGHEYLREIYENPLEEFRVFKKAAQMGISTAELIRQLWLADTKAIKIIYYFPTDDDVRDFAQDRANPIIDDSNYLASLMQYDKADNLGLKQIKDSTVYFRGVFTKRKVKSVDADSIVKDELDESNQENIVFANDRLLHSSLGFISELSQPSVPGFGIDDSYEKSDQRQWVLKCPHCGSWNHVDERFPDSIKVVGKGEKMRAYLSCSRCKRELDKQKGKWVAKRQYGFDRVGRHISQLYSSILSTTDFYKEFISSEKPSEKKRVDISLRGLASASGNMVPVTDEVLKNAEGDHGLATNAMWAFSGKDVGDMIHVVVGLEDEYRRLIVIWFEELSSEKEERLNEIFYRYGIQSDVSDAMPYKPLMKRLAREHPGIVHLRYYPSSSGLKAGLEEDGETGTVYDKIAMDRDEALDDMVDDLIEGKIILPSTKRLSGNPAAEYEIFKKHLKNLTKEEKVMASGKTKLVYRHGVPNHYGMALANLRLAARVARMRITPGIMPIGGSLR